jgi:hypothetical protein
MAEVTAPPATPQVSGGRGAAALTPMSRFPGIWWVALGVLVLNDHALKHAGLLPGWLTGKLSDVAGLIVAPVLAARLARARTLHGRALAFAAVVLPFCAVKLSQAAAGALVAALGAIGIRWRLWSDPTDLVALAAVPMAWHAAQAPAAKDATPFRRRRAAGAGPVILGALACLATSIPIHGFFSSAFLVNMTLQPREVRLYRARGPLDCAAVAATPATALASAFDPELCVPLAVGGVMPLDRNWYLSVPNGIDPPCDAVIIRVADLPDTLLTWQQPDKVIVDDRTGHEASQARFRLDPQGIYLEQAGQRVFAAPSSLITSSPAPIALPDVACASLPDLDGGRAGDGAADAGAAP